jgi:hypothetical protein
MAQCRYFDRLDKFGLLVQLKLLRWAADSFLAAYWTPISTKEGRRSVGRHGVSRYLKWYPEFTFKRQKIPAMEHKGGRIGLEIEKLVSIPSCCNCGIWNSRRRHLELGWSVRPELDISGGLQRPG